MRVSTLAGTSSGAAAVGRSRGLEYGVRRTSFTNLATEVNGFCIRDIVVRSPNEDITAVGFARQVIDSYFMALADGPTEVHKLTLAKQILRGYQPSDDLFPTRHLLKERERAEQKYGQFATLTDDEV